MRWTIFGREPALVVGFVGAVLSVLVGLNLEHLSSEQAGLIVAALGALVGGITAIFTRPVAPGAFLALVTAGAALAAGYGLELSPTMIGAINGLVIATLNFITRGQVSPADQVDPVVMGRDAAGNRRM